VVVSNPLVGAANILARFVLRSIPSGAVDRGAGMKSYHNKNFEVGEELARSEQRARTEEDYIMSYFIDCIETRFSARRVHKDLIFFGWFNSDKPLTNTRRALSNLTSKGYLQKNDKELMVKEGGKRVHTWSLCSREQMRLL